MTGVYMVIADPKAYLFPFLRVEQAPPFTRPGQGRPGNPGQAGQAAQRPEDGTSLSIISVAISEFWEGKNAAVGAVAVVESEVGGGRGGVRVPRTNKTGEEGGVADSVAIELSGGSPIQACLKLDAYFEPAACFFWAKALWANREGGGGEDDEVISSRRGEYTIILERCCTESMPCMFAFADKCRIRQNRTKGRGFLTTKKEHYPSRESLELAGIAGVAFHFALMTDRQHSTQTPTINHADKLVVAGEEGVEAAVLNVCSRAGIRTIGTHGKSPHELALTAACRSAAGLVFLANGGDCVLDLMGVP